MAPLEKFSRSDIKNHNDKESTWLIIEDKVYDVTKFLYEHPGGEETILEEAGKDATEAFINVGHSSEARELLEKYLIGELNDSEKTKKGIGCPGFMGTRKIIPHLALAVVVLGAIVAYRIYRS